ncbi:hypothetical protein ACFSTC_30715 [Nonomuraea ferruginea]
MTGVRADHGPPDPAELGERAERLARNLSRPRSRTPDSRLSKPRLAEPRVMKPRVSKPRVEPPGVSVGEGRVPGKRRPGPLVSVPDVRVYGDAVCVETPRSHVHIGRCRATPAPESTWHASQVSPPVVTPPPRPPHEGRAHPHLQPEDRGRPPRPTRTAQPPRHRPADGGADHRDRLSHRRRLRRRQITTHNRPDRRSPSTQAKELTRSASDVHCPPGRVNPALIQAGQAPPDYPIR